MPIKYGTQALSAAISRDEDRRAREIARLQAATQRRGQNIQLAGMFINPALKYLGEGLYDQLSPSQIEARKKSASDRANKDVLTERDRFLLDAQKRHFDPQYKMQEAVAQEAIAAAQADFARRGQERQRQIADYQVAGPMQIPSTNLPEPLANKFAEVAAKQERERLSQLRRDYLEQSLPKPTYMAPKPTETAESRMLGRAADQYGRSLKEKSVQAYAPIVGRQLGQTEQITTGRGRRKNVTVRNPYQLADIGNLDTIDSPTDLLVGSSKPAARRSSGGNSHYRRTRHRDGVIMVPGKVKGRRENKKVEKVADDLRATEPAVVGHWENARTRRDTALNALPKGQRSMAFLMNIEKPTAAQAKALQAINGYAAATELMGQTYTKRAGLVVSRDSEAAYTKLYKDSLDAENKSRVARLELERARLAQRVKEGAITARAAENKIAESDDYKKFLKDHGTTPGGIKAARAILDVRAKSAEEDRASERHNADMLIKDAQHDRLVEELDKLDGEKARKSKIREFIKEQTGKDLTDLEAEKILTGFAMDDTTMQQALSTLKLSKQKQALVKEKLKALEGKRIKQEDFENALKEAGISLTEVQVDEVRAARAELGRKALRSALAVERDEVGLAVAKIEKKLADLKLEDKLDPNSDEKILRAKRIEVLEAQLKATKSLKMPKYIEGKITPASQKPDLANEVPQLVTTFKLNFEELLAENPPTKENLAKLQKRALSIARTAAGQRPHLAKEALEEMKGLINDKLNPHAKTKKP